MLFKLLQLLVLCWSRDCEKTAAKNASSQTTGDRIGVSFRPMPDAQSTLIRFRKARPTTYAPYVDDIEGVLQYYANRYQQTEFGYIVDCQSVTEMRPEDQWNTACQFDITLDLGSACVKRQNFGYEDGQPCVLLELDKMVDWIPEPFNISTLPSVLQGDTNWSQYSITVDCQGENPTDQENMGDISYFPKNGFHFKYFPYRNQRGYLSPLVFVRFENPEPAALLMITCKVYAKNIRHDVLERAGMVHFELMVD